VAYYDADYTPSAKGSPPRGARLTLILRGGALQGWNGGSYYTPGWTFNPGGTTYLQWWPPESKFFESMQLSDDTHSWRFHLPLWIPIAMASVPATPLIWLESQHLRRARRRRRGLCTRCGYNLSGLHAGGRASEMVSCPECGQMSTTAPG
jgi:hypothetical protein